MRNTKKIRGFLSKTISGFTIFNVILAQVLLAGVFVFTTVTSANSDEPDLTVNKINDLDGGNAVVGTPFNWIITINNSGTKKAEFKNEETVLTDQLPTSGATYGTPTTTLGDGITGAINCLIDDGTLTCTSGNGNDKLEILADGTITVTIPVTPTLAEILVNPISGGQCEVDPNNEIKESDNDNNTCFPNSVTVIDADTTAPILTEVTPVLTPTNDNTPDYTFNSDEAGTITYDGDCSSDTTDAVTGDNTVTFDELEDGTYSDCTIIVTDAADNPSDPLSVSEFTIDIIAPTTSALYNDDFLSSSWYTIPVFVSLEATDDTSGVADTFYILDEEEEFAYDGVFEISEDGIYSLSYWSVDNAGNVEGTQTDTINIDSTPPTSESTPPDYDNSGVIQIPYSASDETSGLDTVKLQYTFDSGETWNDTGDPHSYLGTYSTPEDVYFEFSPLEEGNYGFRTIAKDMAGNEELKEGADGWTEYDRTGPASLAETNPVANGSGWIQNSSVQITISSTDSPSSGVKSISYKIDGNDPIVVESTPIYVDIVGEAIHQVEYWATDNAGNEETPHNLLNVWLDATNPSIPSLTSPEDNTETNTNPTLYWSASTDNLSGVKDYLLRIFKGIAEGEPWFETNAIDTNYDTTGIELPDDTYYWKVRANDNAENSSEWSDVWNFIKDTTKSLLSLLTPSANSYHNSPITISGSATDSTVMTVKYVHLYYQNQTGKKEPWFEIATPENTGGDALFNFSYEWTPLDGSYNIQAVAEDKAGNFSDPAIVEGIIYDAISPLTPVADPFGGDYTNDVTVSLSSEDVNPDAIYYTLDNSDPDSNSTKYDSETKINIGSDTTLKAIAYDKAGNASEIMTEIYGIAPTISNESSSSAQSTSLTATWTTDELATSRVIYGTVSVPDSALGAAPNYGYANSTTEDSNKVTEHSVIVSGLAANTTYYYRSVSHGSPEQVGQEHSTTTVAESTSPATSGGGGGGGNPGSVELTISNEANTNVIETGVTITWTTNYKSTSQIIYAAEGEAHVLNLLDYKGNPPLYGYAHTTLEYNEVPKVINHSINITDLTPGTTYYYRTVSHGSLAIGEEHTFTTPGEQQPIIPLTETGNIGMGETIETATKEITGESFTNKITPEIALQANEEVGAIGAIVQEESVIPPLSTDQERLLSRNLNLFSALAIASKEIFKSGLQGTLVIILIIVFILVLTGTASQWHGRVRRNTSSKRRFRS